ncbi:N-acetylmuramoyl-L-alanine amidase [Lutimaribacter marinistellae]|uniref:N-acetylmuramoyl-L-alanine amidase n=1 Tax=Lutimaribacter marinistellae TaxID=1820329 RepID=A0ABV7TKI6_9RHOB
MIHYTAMESAEAALERLCDPQAEVSAHYLIGADGTLWQLVQEAERAWHAGAGSWRGQGDVNSRSIGIELDNRGDHPFSEPQMTCLEALLHGVMRRWDIAPEGVIGHSDMAPGRKSDPGPRFDWARLALRGLAAPVGRGDAPEVVCAASFRDRAQVAGYTAEVDEAALLEAVRLRYRPGARGPLEVADFTVLG